jgi:WD40 repeat protein
VFVLSPDAARSPICRWEVEEAARLHKRILPVVHRQTELAAIPQELAELNFIDMSMPDDVDRKVAVLAEAINTDIEWVREHTRIGERAEQWSAANRRSSELLRGSALESAERWLSAQPTAGGRPSVLHREFIAASRQGATRRLRFWLAGAVIALVVASGLGMAAELNRREAAAQRDGALLNQSRRLTNLAEGYSRAGNYATAMALALEALPDERRGVRRPYVAAADSVLYQAANALRERRVLRAHKQGVQTAVYSPDGRWIATASRDTTARIWDARAGTVAAVLDGHQGAVWTIEFSPDGRRVVTSSEDGKAQVWDRVKGEAIYGAFAHPASVTDAIYSPDGRWIVTNCVDGLARLWNAATGELVREFPGHKAAVWSSAFSPDSTRIVTTSTKEDGTALVWSLRTPAEPVVLAGPDIRRAAFAPDGRRIVTSSWDKTAAVWDAESGARVFALTGHGDQIATALFSPDGARIVTASKDGTARLWDAATGRELSVLRGHQQSQEIRYAAFSPDSKLVVTASYDKTARVWDAETGDEIAVLAGHDGRVWKAAFSPDGQQVVTASADDQTARVWDSAIANRSLSCAATTVPSSGRHFRRTGAGSRRPPGTEPRGCGAQRTERRSARRSIMTSRCWQWRSLRTGGKS